MRIHFAENFSKSYFIQYLSENNVKNLLFSYITASNAQSAKNIISIFPNANIIIDSGAFSAWSRNEVINIQDYIAFCKELQTLKPDLFIVNLDVIPGVYGRRPTQEEIDYSAERGWKNYETMTNAGLKVLHVFHQHEDFKWLDKLMAVSDYFGVSPANDLTREARGYWLDKVYSKLKANRKTHGFGVTSKMLLENYPWYSVDSTSWKASCRYGRTHFYNMEKAGWNRIPGELTKIMLVKDIQKQLQLELDMTHLWEQRGVVWTE